MCTYPPSESQPQKGHLTSKLNSKTFHVLPSLHPSLTFFFIFYLPGCNQPDFSSVYSWRPCHFYLFVTEQQHFFSSFTFLDSPKQIFGVFLPWLPCHFYLVVTEQQCSPGQLCLQTTNVNV